MPTRSDIRPSLFGHMFVRYLGIDTGVGVLLAAMWLLSFELREPTAAIAVVAGLYVLRFGMWSGYLAWALRSTVLGDARTQEVERTLERLPVRMTALFSATWCGFFVGLPLLVWTVWPELVDLGRADLAACLLQVLAVGIGALALYLPMTRVMLDGPLADIDMQLHAHRETRPRPRAPLAPRLAATGAVLFLAPTLWISSIHWLDQVHDRRQLTVAELRADVQQSAREHAAGRRPLAGVELVAGEPTPVVSRTAGQDHAAGLDRRRELAWAAAATPEGNWLVATRPVEFAWVQFMGVLLLFCVAGLVYGVAMTLVQGRAIMLPLERLAVVTRRVVEVGDLRQMSRLPITVNDEIGDLGRDFNQVLDTFRELAHAADTVAAGDLSLDIDGVGDLPDAFRRMIHQLNGIVIQLRVTALSVGAAISDIHAATREQETATERQLDEIRSLDDHMRALAGSASNVDQSSGEVLDIAERSFTNTAELAAKISSLDQHNRAVEQLLEQVREISGRSDLLALNGSLEATRAGEAGRGFALVAGEMRRLAERVTAIVEDMRSLVADIHNSSVSAVLATDLARTLASETTASARAITNETHRQSAETSQASDATAKLAKILAESSVSIVQTRAIAEALQQQAEHLEYALASFKLREF